MNIELKKISHHAGLSEETYAFTAEVWIDGKKAALVRNAGHGGAHFWSDWTVAAQIEAHAKTLPPMDVSDLYGDGQKHTLELDGDTLISNLVSDWLIAKDLKRALAKRILYVKQGETCIRQTKPLPADVQARMLAQTDKLKTTWQTEKVLNLMPFNEALAVFRAATT